MKRLVMLPCVLALAACATEFSVPVTGKIGNEPAQGAATARMDGNGTFFALTSRGMRCDGTYDSRDTSPTIVALATCSDGRKGNLIITRSLDGASGTVIGRLNDGTEARFVFGNLSYGQAFDGSSAATAPVR